MADRNSTRAQRLAVRRKAQDALGALRALTRVLKEWERLEDADDMIGVVQISPSDAESDYAADVLDLVGQAVKDAGRSRVVNVFVMSTTDTESSDQGQGETQWPEMDSTPTAGHRRASEAKSSSVTPSTTPRA